MIKVRELRQKSKKELEAFLSTERERLIKLRFDLKSKKVKNVKELQATRINVARILTLLKENKSAS
jgi:ribosomal protein L29